MYLTHVISDCSSSGEHIVYTVLIDFISDEKNKVSKKLFVDHAYRLPKGTFEKELMFAGYCKGINFRKV